MFLQFSNRSWKHPHRSVLASYPHHTSVKFKVKDPAKKLHLLHTIKTVPCVQYKANWALKWCNPPTIVLLNKSLYFLPSKAYFSRALFAPYFGSRSTSTSTALVSVTNSSVTTMGCTAISHVYSTPNWSIVSLKHVLLPSLAVKSKLKWSQNWNGFWIQRPLRQTHWNEFNHDVQVQLHQVMCWTTPGHPWLSCTLKNQPPAQMDGNDQPSGKANFFGNRGSSSEASHQVFFVLDGRSKIFKCPQVRTPSYVNHVTTDLRSQTSTPRWWSHGTEWNHLWRCLHKQTNMSVSWKDISFQSNLSCASHMRFQLTRPCWNSPWRVRT